MVAGSAFHRARRTYEKHVDRYIVHTEFARQRFIAHGLPPERIAIRGNCLPEDPGLGASSGNYALYVGRLTAEKGVGTLIRAWRSLPGIPLRIAGDGELRAALERDAAGLPVKFLGRVPPSRVIELMQNAALLVVPSECYEGFPRVVVEAFATGAAIVASDIGGLGELIRDGMDGMKFRPRSTEDLAAAVMRSWSAPQMRAHQRIENRRRFEIEYSPTAGFESLRRIYLDARQQFPSSALSVAMAEH
jgi:glycosyltransferase involved in cell wall biosynthesis